MKQINFKKIITLLLLLVLILNFSSIIYQVVIHSQGSSNTPVVALDPLVEELMNEEFTSQENETQDTGQKNQVQILKHQYNNEDIKGILSIANENFRYPVAQTTNNEFYLTHDYYKNSASLGAIYADYRTDLDQIDRNKKVLIFGHSSSKTNTPFNELEKYYDKDYYQTHKYITLETNTNTYQYEIFSVYVETSDFTYMNVNFEDQEEWYFHLLNLQKKSMYSTNVILDASDDILIMQTCSKHSKYKDYSKKYLLIVSRRVK